MRYNGDGISIGDFDMLRMGIEFGCNLDVMGFPYTYIGIFNDYYGDNDMT